MIGLYMAFIVLVIFGGLLIYVGNEVIQIMSAASSTQFPSAWTGQDGLTLIFVENWWVWLRLFLLIGGFYWLIVQTQRMRETGQ